MDAFLNRENKVLNFMDKVEQQKNLQKEEDTFKQSTDYKLKKLDQCQDEAKVVCLDNIFRKIYKDAVPLNDEYKTACNEDLDAAFKTFMDQRCPKGLEYYVKEGIRKNSPFARKVLEAVDELVKNEYKSKAFNIENIDANDLVFNSNDDVTKKLDIIGQELSGPEIAATVQDNVKQTALSEITRAKKEKEDLKQLEKDLANDVNINTAEALESALEFHGISQKKDYTPTLFQGIMISKVNELQPKFEAGEMNVNIYGTLEMYGKESVEPIASLEEVAFVEAVKEYTALSLMKALRLESFNKYEVADLAQEYAQK